MTIYPAEDFPCSLKNIVELLNKAGWSIPDSDGKIRVWNEAAEELEVFSGSLEDFLKSTEYKMFYAYNGSMSVSVYINDIKSFSISPEEYTQKIVCDGRRYFDYNWYYINFIIAFNKDNYIVERVTFDEY